MPLITETISNNGGNQRWLGSAHGIWNGRTLTLDMAKFAKATHYPQGYIPGGTPLSITDGYAVPYDGTNIAGHLLEDFPVVAAGTAAKEPVGVLYHGTVIAANVPGTFTAPAAQKQTTITYL